jgi:biopolymer transport protein ExbB
MTDLLPSPALLADTAKGLSLLLESLQSGGFIMVLIVLASMIGVTICVITYLRMNEKVLLPKAVEEQLRALPKYAAKGDITPLHTFLKKDKSLLARLGYMAVEGHHPTRQECNEVVSQKAKEELHSLERDIPFLEVMVTVAPLLGLLGPTVGLVGMFSAFGDGGAGGPDTTAVAREIGVALRCTIAGLLVAVPAVIAHTWFVRKLDRIAMRLESILQDSINSFYQHFEVQRNTTVLAPRDTP